MITKTPSLKATGYSENGTNWVAAHNQALQTPLISRDRLGAPLIDLLKGWSEYADLHHKAYESLIGDDYVLGPHWRDIGLGLRGLLNGDCGPRLDCGTLDKFIIDTLEANGFDTKELGL